MTHFDACSEFVSTRVRDYLLLVQTKKHHGIAGLLNLFGIASPGLTASLALAVPLVRDVLVS